MTTEKYLSYFFSFNKIDFAKKGMESSHCITDLPLDLEIANVLSAS